jgi:glycosyltransferase involved in cell wall biosynthesis
MVRRTIISTSLPLVSVLMPAFNAAKVIEDSIESILHQSFTHFELIILDDSSTDATWDIIQKYKKDSRVILLKNKKNEYIAKSRNTLLSKAKGKYIAWQDADDISMPQRLAKQVSYLEENPKVGLIGGFLEFFSKNGVESIRKYEKNDRELRKRIFMYSPVAQPAAMIRKECFDEFGKYNEAYPPAEDIDMSFRIGQEYLFANLQEVVLLYRVTLTSATFSKLKKIELTTLKVRWKYRSSQAYKITFIDVIYNILQLLSVFCVPPIIKIRLFNNIRNSKLS